MRYAFFCTALIIHFFLSGQSRDQILPTLLEYVSNNGSTLKNFILDHNPSVDKQLLNDFVESSVESLEYQIIFNKIYSDYQIQSYLQEVTKNVLSSDPHLLEFIKIGIGNSASVNAQAFPSGLITLNLGLLAVLESEAELAFIIAHEASHIKEQHSLESFNRSVNMEDLSKDIRSESLNDSIDSKFEFSRQQEFYSDSLGLVLMSNFGYQVKASETALTKLYYGYLPVFNIPFDKRYFDTGNLHFSESYFPDHVDSLADISNYNERYKTHPNISDRITSVKKLNESLISDSLKSNASSETAAFNNMKNRANQLMVSRLLIGLDYGEAIYHSYCLEKMGIQSQEDAAVIPLAYYGLLKYKLAEKFHLAAKPYTQVQLESQNVHYFLKSLNTLELALLALAKIDDLESQMVLDDHLIKIRKDIYKILFFEKDKPNYVNRIHKWKIDAPLLAENVLRNIKDQEYIKSLDSLKKEQDNFLKMTFKEREKYRSKRAKDMIINGPGINTRKVTFIDPYVSYISRHTDSKDFSASRQYTNGLQEEIIRICDKNNLFFDFFDLDQEAEISETFKNQIQINQMFLEALDHYPIMDSPIVFEKLESDDSNRLMVKLSIDYDQKTGATFYLFSAFDPSEGKIIYSHREKLTNSLKGKRLSKVIEKDIMITTN